MKETFRLRFYRLFCGVLLQQCYIFTFHVKTVFLLFFPCQFKHFITFLLTRSLHNGCTFNTNAHNSGICLLCWCFCHAWPYFDACLYIQTQFFIVLFYGKVYMHYLPFCTQSSESNCLGLQRCIRWLQKYVNVCASTDVTGWGFATFRGI